MAKCDISVDPSEAVRELDQLQRHSDMVLSQTTATLRKGYTSVSIFMDLIGQSLNAALDMLIQSLFMYSESAMLFAQAGSIMGSPRAIILFTMASILAYRAIWMRGERDRWTNAFDSAMKVGSLWI